MFDAALYYGEKAEHHSRILQALNLEPRGFILATLHRQENPDDPERLANILKGIAVAPVPVVWPLHPRTRKRLAEFGFDLPPTVSAIDPVGYLDMVMLEKHARCIATDSGSMQKEAFFHRVPCLTLRDETEWVETVEAGWNRLVGADAREIRAGWSRISNHCQVEEQPKPYGSGNAATKIVNILKGAE